MSRLICSNIIVMLAQRGPGGTIGTGTTIHRVFR
jgi:hypothetical protein